MVPVDSLRAYMVFFEQKEGYKIRLVLNETLFLFNEMPGFVDLFCPRQIFAFAQKVMTLQNNLSLISYQDQRYHLAVGANCQSACVSYLPDRGKSAARRVEMLRMQSPLPCGGKRVLGSRAADVGSRIDRTAR